MFRHPPVLAMLPTYLNATTSGISCLTLHRKLLQQLGGLLNIWFLWLQMGVWSVKMGFEMLFW